MSTRNHVSTRKAAPPLALLFVTNLTILFVGMGLFPILPSYATLFGAGPTLVGIYFAIINATLAGGSLVAGALATRFSIQGVFILSGLLGIPSLALLGLADQLWQVILLTAAIWFFGGLNLALISMLLGLVTRKETRGRAFSLIALTIPLGAMLGAAGIGALVAAVDYQGMFYALGGLWAIIPLVGTLFPAVDEGAAAGTAELPPQTAANYRFYHPNEPFAAVLYITLIAVVAVSAGRLGAPLAMQSLAFSPGQIASSVMVGGGIAIPVVMVAGFLSDRVSRSRFLIFAYASATAGILLLAISTQLWHFWISSGFILIAVCLNGALASAVAADVLPPADLKRGLAWLNACMPAASIAAYGLAGYLSETLGYGPFFFLLAALPLAAAGLMGLALRRCRRALQVQGVQPVQQEAWEDNAYFKRCLQ